MEVLADCQKNYWEQKVLKPYDFSIIIVNYNTADLVSHCIESVLCQQQVTAEIIVIDNASQDDSLSVLKKYEQANQIVLINHHENSGFGRASNIASEKAHGNYLFFLNPDGKLKDNFFLKSCFDYMEQHPDCGLAGTAVYEPRKNRFVQPQFKYPSEKIINNKNNKIVFSNLPGEIAWVLGASMIIKKSLFEKVKGFDPDFFLYGEETDLCLRIRKAGFKIGFIDSAVVEHYSGASEKTASVYSIYHRKQRGYYLFCQKHYAMNDVKKIAKKNLFRASLQFAWVFLLKKIYRHNLKKYAHLDSKSERVLANIQSAKEALNSV